MLFSVLCQLTFAIACFFLKFIVPTDYIWKKEYTFITLAVILQFWMHINKIKKKTGELGDIKKEEKKNCTKIQIYCIMTTQNLYLSLNRPTDATYKQHISEYVVYPSTIYNRYR